LFEEENKANILPTIEVDISQTLGFIEKIILGASSSTENVISYKSLFQEFCVIFS